MPAELLLPASSTARWRYDVVVGTPRIDAGVHGGTPRYGIGLEDLPNCRAAYEQWGARVRQHTPGGGIRRHAPGSPLECRPRPWRIDPSWNWCDTHR